MTSSRNIKNNPIRSKQPYAHIHLLTLRSAQVHFVGEAPPAWYFTSVDKPACVVLHFGGQAPPAWYFTSVDNPKDIIFNPWISLKLKQLQ